MLLETEVQNRLKSRDGDGLGPDSKDSRKLPPEEAVYWLYGPQDRQTKMIKSQRLLVYPPGN